MVRLISSIILLGFGDNSSAFFKLCATPSASHASAYYISRARAKASTYFGVQWRMGRTLQDLYFDEACGLSLKERHLLEASGHAEFVRPHARHCFAAQRNPHTSLSEN